ncbi:acylneuraminate cytidylyltransferase family protein [Synechococcus sp. LTW-R]|uniref:acylneuraminate cytidylyltransferase family protein n=1 Tax=Synechococcus sp. LTW-R TaxID=2751170 RepID=UPI002106703E|nr:acylneuraminate cytidylyltransferase family protein [Synechococcus sp. LTW-R]
MALKPLCFWSIEAALELEVPVYISTEDPEIKETIANSYQSVLFVDRPSRLAQDSSSTEDVIDHFFSVVSPSNILLIQATSPLTRGAHLSEAIKLFKENNRRPLVSCVRKHQFLWGEDGRPINYNPEARPRRQDWDGCLIENGAFYIFSREAYLLHRCRCAPPVTLYEMSSIHGIEVDDLTDWNLVESLLHLRLGQIS